MESAPGVYEFDEQYQCFNIPCLMANKYCLNSTVGILQGHSAHNQNSIESKTHFQI